MVRYDLRSGDDGEVVRGWPAASGLELDSDRPTAVFFVHPRCPCSVASVHELGELVRQSSARWYAVVREPEEPDAGEAAAWRGGRVLAALDGLPEVRQVRDAGARLAGVFGAETSGLLAVYGPDGTLRYRGGLTGSRGHIGANPARSRAQDALVERQAAASTAPVFGCSLDGSED